MKKRWMSAVAVSWIVFPLFAWAQSSSEESWHLDTGRIIGGSSQESGVRLMDPVMLDWDGDGIDDVVFGAPAAAPNGVSNAGSLYVLAGKRDRTFSGTLDMTYWDSFDWRFDGHTPNGQLGMQLYVGDFNGDGKMSAFESAAEFQFLHDVVMADEADDELSSAGLDRDELSWMDADERREALEDAGLDPFDFDDDF